MKSSLKVQNLFNFDCAFYVGNKDKKLFQLYFVRICLCIFVCYLLMSLFFFQRRKRLLRFFCLQ